MVRDNYRFLRICNSNQIVDCYLNNLKEATSRSIGSFINLLIDLLLFSVIAFFIKNYF